MNTSDTALLRNYLSKNFPIENPGREEFVNLFEKRTYKKKDLLLTNGKVDKELRFVNKGFIREYFMNPHNEVNINFYSEGHFSTDFISYHASTPSLKNQECLTEVELLVASKEKCDLLNESNYSEGQLFLETSFKRVLRANEIREFQISTNTPDVLYREIMKKHPKWLLNIPQYHIASYLRITPETLSRIRKRIS